MKRLLTLLVLFPLICFGQKQANVWYFGNHAGVGHGEIYQYNLSAGNISAIIASKTNILNGPDSWRQMQLGPNGKLYLSRIGKPYLSEIEFPNNLFPTCNYIDSAIYLEGKFASFGLPNYIAGFNYSNTVFSCETGINEQDINELTFVFPNPITDNLIVNIDNYELTEIILYDLSSRKLLQQTFTNSTTVNTEQLAKGMYFYIVRNRNGVIKTGKVIKE